MDVQLRSVTSDNWYACTQLKVKDTQRNVFPAPVVYWIAESKYVDGFELRAIYDQDNLVGFIVFVSIPDEDGNYWIFALMIDEKYQGKGYGKAAMKALLQLMLSLGYSNIMLGHRPNNEIAGRLYESLGLLQVSDEVIDGEIIRKFQAF